MLISKEVFDLHLINELKPLFKEAKEEVYLSKECKSLSEDLILKEIDFQNYLFLQKKGLLFVFCLRDENKKLVGFHISNIFTHNQSINLKCAYVDACFVKKEYRGISSIKLINHAELQIKKNHVKYIYWGVNPKLGTHNLLEKMNWKLDELVYVKELK